MNSETFVDAIKVAVCEAAAKGMMDILERPPGRHPDPELVRLSEWYHSLAPADRNRLGRVVDLSTKQATYNFLLVLDGLVAVEPAGPKGRLQLSYDEGKTRAQLNNENDIELSSLFKQRE
jgi:hypothetical protein